MGEGIIDLRSDTVTKPGPAMRKAMADAEVGDDVFGEDPTVNALQEEVADLFGKEAAIFVPSGTMANQVSLKAHTQPGDEVVVHPGAHLYRAESAAGAALSGVQFRLVGNPDGTLSVQEIEGVIQSGDNPHFAPTRLICLENTHNFAGGSALLPEYVDTVAELAARHGLPMHLDGARVMNASVFLGVPPARLAAPFRSVTLCFSKGLGAPVGSIIAGPRDFITRCHRFRKMFGAGAPPTTAPTRDTT
ncbi:MAG: aminotransferase class I/II-fold pyridoxal phosphate-dependent enzyme [Proteobacteria bacterium]|nr:aminotransferase class I/II-fold pyridoxal phosphate-dependent enzyme [Pseudomonadota bacterium]